MSGSGSPSIVVSRLDGVRLAVVASLWHEQVMDGLVAGSVRAAEKAEVTPEVIRVPGAFELGVTAATCAAAGFDAIVALGVVIRGGTPHFEYVCRAATDALNRVALDSGVPIGFGLLTCDDEAQALDRVGLPGSREDKGFEATVAALETLRVLREVRGRTR